MIEEKRYREIQEAAHAATKKHGALSFVSTLGVLIVALACAGLACLYPETLLVSVPLLLFPMLLSLQVCLSSLQAGNAMSHRDNLRFFSLYFRELYGVYRGFLTMAKCLGVALLGMLVIGTAYASIASAVSPSFQTAMNDWMSLLSKNDAESIYQYYQSSAELLAFSSAMLSGGLYCGLEMLLHCFASNAMNTFFRSSAQGMPSRAANYTYSNFRRQNRTVLSAWSYGLFYPGIILSTVGYGVGVAIAFPFEALRPYAPGIALGMSSLFLLPFLPYFFFAIERMAKLLRKEYAESSLKLAEESLETMKKMNAIEGEDLKNAEESLQKAKEEFEKDQKNGEEPREQEDDDDNPYGER